jgi:penicillin amidase
LAGDRLRDARRRFLRALAALVLAVVILAASISGGARAGCRQDGTEIPGLGAPVEVRFDPWGMPEVEAESGEDLAAALGWLHANDRFFQMELGRRAAAGRLSELFGSRTLSIDRRFRELRLRPTAERSVETVGAEARAWLAAYARGVNAWLAARGRDLPPELVLLGVEPEPWTSADSLISHADGQRPVVLERPAGGGAPLAGRLRRDGARA